MSDGVNSAIPGDGDGAAVEPGSIPGPAAGAEPQGGVSASTVQSGGGVAGAGAGSKADANAETTFIPAYLRTPEPAPAPPVYTAPEPAPSAPLGPPPAVLDSAFSNAAPPDGAVPGPGSGGAAFDGPSEPPRARIPRRLLVIAGGLVTVGAAGGIAAAVAGSGGSSSKQLPTAGGTGKAAANGGAGTAAASPSPTYPPVSTTTVPANGASNVDPSQAVTVTVANGAISSVELSGGQTTSGTLSNDKSSWTSNGALSINTSYTLQVEVTGMDGKTATTTASFSTLKPTATLGVAQMWPGDGVSVGVGQPIRVQFTNYVPKEYRAAVEKACVVTTSPAVAGAWSWVQEDMMDWRPQNFWATGTHVSVALNLSGVRAGAHQYGVKNHSLDFTIRDTDLRLIVDAAAYHATCYQNGQVIRSWAVDTGMNDPRFVTWSGTLAVLDKGNPVEMKGDYGNGDKYDELVNWATQITYSGTYVHAAPWDGEIGHVNSSHGCIHCATSDATWFYNMAHVGDVVQVTGTNKTVALTNGFGDFGTSWSAWLSGSSYGATIGGTPTST